LKKLGDISFENGAKKTDRNHIVEYLKKELKLEVYYVVE
jgi:hypothetical protein